MIFRNFLSFKNFILNNFMQISIRHGTRSKSTRDQNQPDQSQYSKIREPLTDLG